MNIAQCIVKSDIKKWANSSYNNLVILKSLVKATLLLKRLQSVQLKSDNRHSY